MDRLFTRSSRLPARPAGSGFPKGSGLSLFEGDITGSADTRLSVAQLLALVGEGPGIGGTERHRAIACFLSASEGWKEAARALGGAFAGDNPRLTETKTERKTETKGE